MESKFNTILQDVDAVRDCIALSFTAFPTGYGRKISV